MAFEMASKYHIHYEPYWENDIWVKTWRGWRTLLPCGSLGRAGGGEQKGQTGRRTVRGTPRALKALMRVMGSYWRGSSAEGWHHHPHQAAVIWRGAGQCSSLLLFLLLAYPFTLHMYEGKSVFHHPRVAVLPIPCHWLKLAVLWLEWLYSLGNKGND